MNSSSFAELSGKAVELLNKHGNISTSFLMRNLKVDYATARSIMKRLGWDIWITAEEYGITNKS